jgi:type II secretory pathway pseudopilin PulG
VLFESALIVFSVLLALALEEWRDERVTASRAREAVAAITAELQANRSACLAGTAMR